MCDHQFVNGSVDEIIELVSIIVLSVALCNSWLHAVSVASGSNKRNAHLEIRIIFRSPPIIGIT